LKKVFNNRSLFYERPKRTKWTDTILNQVLVSIKKGFTYAQIAKNLEVNTHALVTILSYYRNKPEWAGKIPYIKISRREEPFKAKDRIGILDIEFCTFGGNRFHLINARLGCILSYALKEYKKNVWYSEKINLKDLRNEKIADRKITKNLIDNISKFDIIVGFFSSGCDIPFIRTRAMNYDMDFPKWNTIKQIDLWHFAKKNLLLDHNSLKTLSSLLRVKGKDNIQFEEWMKVALFGNQKSLDNIFSHNIGDVKATEGDLIKIEPYLSPTLRSI